jgi:hypothetical protein
MKHLEYILSKINKAMVSKTPFDHFIIHDFLPEDLYKRLVQANDKLTNDNLKVIQKIEIHNDGEFKPTLENIHKAGTITYNMYKADSVHEEVDILLSNVQVKEAIFNRFGITDEAKGGSELVREINIDLLPHTDMNHKGLLLNFQVYCPIDDSHSNLGVKLLKKFKAFNVMDGYMTLKSIPYIPNIAWCIKPSENSWHKVDPIKDLTDFNRDSLMMRYYKLTI